VNDADVGAGAGKAQLIISTGSTVLQGRGAAKNIEYFICEDKGQRAELSCITTCPRDDIDATDEAQGQVRRVCPWR